MGQNSSAVAAAIAAFVAEGTQENADQMVGAILRTLEEELGLDAESLLPESLTKVGVQEVLFSLLHGGAVLQRGVKEKTWGSVNLRGLTPVQVVVELLTHPPRTGGGRGASAATSAIRAFVRSYKAELKGLSADAIRTRVRKALVRSFPEILDLQKDRLSSLIRPILED